MRKIKFRAFLVGLAAMIFVVGYFTSFAATQPTLLEKQLEGIWKPVQFLKFDYEASKFVSIPLQDVEGGIGENYLHLKGNTLCSNGVLEGPNKKICTDNGDTKFREFWPTLLTAGGTRLNVWADDEKTYTMPIDIELKNGKLIETYGDGSTKTYQKIKNSDIHPKKPKKKKSSELRRVSHEARATKTSKPQGIWHVVAIYDGPGPDGPFTPNTIWSLEDYAFDIIFKGKGFCTTHWKDAMDATNTKPHCEDSLTFKKDGTFIGAPDGRLQAWGGFMKLNGPQLEFYEGGMGYTKYVLEKKSDRP